jgi:hypothetical protein
MNGLDNIQIRNLSPVFKLFVGLFVTLMFCVVFWAGFIYVVHEGMVDDGDIAVYSGGTATEVDLRGHDQDDGESAEDELEENVGLAHTHINGQTLLFLALGLVFLFTSTPIRHKKIVLWVFGISIAAHAVGLSGQDYHWFYDDILTISGIAILVCIIFMVLRTYMDLGKKVTTP